MGEKIYTGINVIQYVAIVFQTEQIFQWVQVGLAILMTLVGIAYKVWKWYKEAKEDGKITLDEVEDVVKDNIHDVKQVVEETKELVDDIKENSKK